MSNIAWHETNMTSNTTPVPLVASASSEFATSLQAWGAFNGKTDTYGWASKTARPDNWLKIQFGAEMEVDRVRVRASGNASSTDPKSIEIKAKENGREVVLYSGSQSVWNYRETREFVFDRKYKITEATFSVTPIGSSTYVAVGQILFGVEKPNNKTLILHNGEYKKYQFFSIEDVQYEDVIPKMTSDTTPTGIASASSTNTTTTVQPSAPWYAFDKSSSSDHTKIWYANAVAPQWLEYEFPNAQKIAKYSILRRANRFEGSPNSWEFQAFNETTQNWDVLDSISNFQMTNSGYYEFLIDWSKQGEYKKYRIYITATQANEVPMVNELIMYKATGEPTPSEWLTVSSVLPSSTQFLEQGMDSLSPLLNRKITTLEPMIMVDKSEILGVGETGKVFSKTMDLKKHFDFRSIRTEVK